MHNTARAAVMGLSISAQVATQVIDYMKTHPENADEFWLSFMSGLAGAMAAHIGFASADEVLGSVAEIHAKAKAKINKTTH